MEGATTPTTTRRTRRRVCLLRGRRLLRPDDVGATVARTPSTGKSGTPQRAGTGRSRRRHREGPHDVLPNDDVLLDDGRPLRLRPPLLPFGRTDHGLRGESEEEEEDPASSPRPRFRCCECGAAFPAGRPLSNHLWTHVRGREDGDDGVDEEDVGPGGRRREDDDADVEGCSASEDADKDGVAASEVADKDSLVASEVADKDGLAATEDADKGGSRSEDLDKDREVLLEHRPVVTSMPCDKCSEASPTRCSSLRQHGKFHHATPSECEPCGDKFGSKSSDIAFREVKHTGEKAFECRKKFTNRTSPQQHDRPPMGERPFKCNQCPKTFAEEGHLASHVIVHTREKPFECVECGKKFGLNFALVKHMAVHTGGKPFECKHCGEKFSLARKLATHVLVHSDDKPFECDHGGERLADSTSARPLTATHAKPYECSQCQSGFSRRAQLARHMEDHMRPSECGKRHKRRFVCYHCGEEYALKSALEEHVVAHISDNPFPCYL